MTLRIKNIMCVIVAIILSGMLLAVGIFGGNKLSESKKNSALRGELESVLPNITDFEVEIPSDTMSDSVKEIYVSDVGIAVRLGVTGYASGLEILCGIKDGEVVSARSVLSRETLGAEKTYGDNFKNKDMESAKQVPTVSGATKTTSAYKQAVIDALDVYVQIFD